MKCHKCGNETLVHEKRWMPVMYQMSGYNMRRRKCKKCQFRFMTEEVYIKPVADMHNRKKI